MKLVIFGLTVSSSWGNGHATLWRGLCRALSKRGHEITFFEKDVPYYAGARDLTVLPGGGELVLYSEWETVLPFAQRQVDTAEVVMVTSYCPDGLTASSLALESNAPLRVFYDLDAPVTLYRISLGENVPYVGPHGYSDFDLVLSYTGGSALSELRRVLGATRVFPLYGSVDPDVHKPAMPVSQYRAALSYMGTWSADRDKALRTLFMEPARTLESSRFVIGGAKYESDFQWLPNIYFVNHLAPDQHSAFYSSSSLTLNITRQPMAAMGYCPSGRLFEAAACGVPILSDDWKGLETFLTPDSEILVGRSSADVIAAINLPHEERQRIGQAARARTLACHTADVRAAELEKILEDAVPWMETPEANSVCGA
jgi:spore maturation protein CgeB